MSEINNDTTIDNRAVIWSELSRLAMAQDSDGYIWLHFTDLYTGDTFFELHTLIELGLLERVYNVDSIDKDAEDWRAYFKRDAHRITHIGRKILRYRSVYIHEGVSVALDTASTDEMQRVKQAMKESDD